MATTGIARSRNFYFILPSLPLVQDNAHPAQYSALLDEIFANVCMLEAKFPLLAKWKDVAEVVGSFVHRFHCI